jgi:hypothetical protein
MWSYFTTLVLSAFALNWLWEMIQMPAFVEVAGRSWGEMALPCASAALGDVAMTFGIYGLGCLAAGYWRWGLAGRWNMYLTGALLGGVFASAFEWYSMSTNRWTYNERMPIVPILNVGLWPLLQLILLVPSSWAIAAWWTKRASGAGSRNG